jgi:hypothetical protein
MPLKGEARRRHDKARDNRRRAAHRKAKDAGVPGTPVHPNWPRPNEFGATTIDLLAVDVHDRVRELAAKSVPHTLIARCLGMTLPAFKKHCEVHPEFQAALDAGHAEEELWAVSRLRQMADSDGKQAVLATLAILNSRHGWRGEHRGGPPQVVINLPGPLSGDQYERLISTPQPVALPAPPASEGGDV